MAKKKNQTKNDEAVVQESLSDLGFVEMDREPQTSEDETELFLTSEEELRLEDEAQEDEMISLPQEEETAGFLPEVSEEALLETLQDAVPEAEFAGSELEDFESAEIEDLEFIEEERLDSIVESIFFASDRPVSLNSIKMVFKGTSVRTEQIRRAIDRLAMELAGSRRGVTLEEVPGGYQLRTKFDNMQFITRTLKARPFRLSGPALEVLAIAAYKQPIIKSEIDEIRGVESGHLLRALMEKGLVHFEGKSDLPGKPMLYATSRKFLEIFGLRNLKELPTLSQIDELLPEGIDEESSQEKPTLSQLTDSLSQTIGSSYSDGEDELSKISDQLQVIETTSNFFEEEKLRQKQKRDAEKAQSLREALLVNEEISTRDRNWLNRYDEALAAGSSAEFSKQELVASGDLKIASTPEGSDSDLQKKVQEFDNDADLESASFDEAPADDEELAVPYHDEDEEPEAEV